EDQGDAVAGATTKIGTRQSEIRSQTLAGTHEEARQADERNQEAAARCSGCARIPGVTAVGASDSPKTNSPSIGTRAQRHPQAEKTFISSVLPSTLAQFYLQAGIDEMAFNVEQVVLEMINEAK